jgi:aryl sulfotransferase
MNAELYTFPQLLRAPTRAYRNSVLDARRWDAFRPRPGDVVVATYPKCGTTWMQRIVDLLIHQSSQPRSLMGLYPFLDATMLGPVETQMEQLDAQVHRRALKSHLPFDSLPVFDTVKYIHVSRDGRDACFSLHNHFVGMTEIGLRIASGATWDPKASAAPVPREILEFYREWIGDAEAGRPSRGMELSYFDFEMTYWRERMLPNLLLVHFNDLKLDLEGEMRRITTFLEIDTPPAHMTELAASAGFAAMKAEGDTLMPGARVIWDRGADRFLNHGTNGRWKNLLTAEDLARFEAQSEAKLTAAARAWLEGGRAVAGDPVRLPD